MRRLNERLKRGYPLTCQDSLVRIVSAFICNYVEVQSALLYAQGAFPEWWTVPEVPCEQMLGLALVAEVEPSEIDTRFNLQLAVRREGDPSVQGHGEINFCRGASGQYVAGAPLYLGLPLRLGVRFDDVGPHRITILHNAEEVADIRFGVRVV